MVAAETYSARSQRHRQWSRPTSGTVTRRYTHGPSVAPGIGTLSGTAPSLTYTPAANYNGTDSFTFKVNDGTVDSNVATVTITVTPVNDAPVANLVADTVSGLAPLTVNFDASKSTDVDVDNLAYAWDFGDSTNGNGGIVVHTYNAVGTYVAKVTVTDGHGGSSTAEKTITVVAGS